jgi:hypothetical protein
MISRLLIFLFLFSGTVAFAQKKIPLRKSLETSERAIRMDVPMTNSIRKAFSEGTRDFTGSPGANYWQIQTDYNIKASLNPNTQIITGSETITLHNNSPVEMTQIVLKLDHNIFRGDVPRGSSVPAETTEGMVLTRITVNGDLVDLAPIPRPRQRGGQLAPRLEASRLQQTVAYISLAKPIPANSKATIEIDWNTKLPGGQKGNAHRMTQRWDNTLFQPTQWFPRVAKFDDLRGWKTQPYLGPAEFFNNFGRFDVKIKVPAGWLVSGTGVLQNPEEVLMPSIRERLAKITDSDDEITIVGIDERGAGKATANGESLTWHFVADQVNDFAWATSADFIWKATRATIPGKGEIPIHMVYLPERAERFARAGVLGRHALEFYSNLWAPYAFPQLTFQDGPSAGMEYPMVVNSNQGAADHEIAHQWWPMMLGTNETRYGWMDEGFNSYMNILSANDSRGVPFNLDGRGMSYGRVSGGEDEATMMWNANYGGDGYGYQTYSKAPAMLSMLGGIVGDDKVIAAMKKYSEVWAFKHPSPWDYMFFMNNELDQNLEWFWYYWLWTTESVEGSIQNVETGSNTEVTVHQAGEMPSPVVLKVEFETTGPAIKSMENAVMIDDNTVMVTYPVDVWLNGSRTYKANLSFGERKITKITLDPGRRFPDKDVRDNVWTNK